MNIILNIEKLVIMLCATVYSAYTLTMLWKWFIIGTFGLPMLTLPVAYGIVLISFFLTTAPINPFDMYEQYFKIRDIIETDDCNILYRLYHILTGYWICKPTLVLLSGWIVKTVFM